MGTPRIVRRVAVGAALLGLALGGAGCGGSGGGSGSDLDKTFRYFPPDASAVVVVSTDVESAQFRNLDAIVEARAHRTIETLLRDGAGALGLSYEKDFKPLLGHELAVATSAGIAGGGFGASVILAFRATSGGKLRDVLDRAHVLRRGGKIDGAQVYRISDGPALAVDGDVLVATEAESTLRTALDRAHGGDHFDPAQFDRAMSGLPSDALVRAYGDVTVLGALPQLANFRGVPWFDALRTVVTSVSFEHAKAVVDFAANTDGTKLKETDLPLATGDDPPEVLKRPGEVVSGNRKQSLTTAFLYHVAEVAFPHARFVQNVHALQRQLKIDFVDEVLRQFDGPSASAVSLDGKTFAARSDVSDPARLQRVLPRLGPHLPAIVRALQGLQSQGEAILFLFAPDVLVGQGDAVKVTPPATANGLWHVTGLQGEGPSQLYFGVIGKRFVVASSETTARQVANEATEKVAGAHGAAVLRVDLSKVAQDQLDQANLNSVAPLGELVAWVEASRSHLHGRASLELP